MLSPHTTEIPVLWSQMDANGHVNNGTFQFFFDEARMRALEFWGFSISDLRAEQIGPVVQKAEITYHKPLGHPDTACIETRFTTESQIRGKVFQTLKRKSDGALVCEAVFFALFYDFKKKRPWKLPVTFYQETRIF